MPAATLALAVASEGELTSRAPGRVLGRLMAVAIAARSASERTRAGVTGRAALAAVAVRQSAPVVGLERRAWVQRLLEELRTAHVAHEVVLGPVGASIAVSTLAMLLVVHGVATATLNLDSLGLASSLPIAWYVGTGGLMVAGAVALGDRRRGAWVLLGLGFVAGLVVWLTPLAMEGTPHFRTAFENYGYVDPILRGQGLVPGVFLYHNWPVFPLTMAALLVTTGISAISLLEWYPVVMVMAYAALTVVFVRIVTQRFMPAQVMAVGMAAAVWSYFEFNWTEQEYFSPQAMAYLVFLVLLCVLAWVSVQREGLLTTRLTAAVIGLFTLIVATHVLTSLVVLGVLFALVWTGFIKRPTILITCGLIFIVWQVTIAAPFFVFYGSQLISNVLGGANFLAVTVESRVRGDPGHILVTQLRIVGSAVPYLFAGLPFLGHLVTRIDWRTALRRRRLPALPVPLSFPVASMLGIGLIAPVSVYGGEMLIRVLFFSLPCLGVLIAYGMQERWYRWVAVATLVVMAPLHMYTHYGNEMMDYVSPSELQAYSYMATLAPANIFGGFPIGNTYDTLQFDARNSFVFNTDAPTSLADYENPWLHHTWVHTDWPLYVVVSRGDAAAMAMFMGSPQLADQAMAYLDTSSDYSRVYSNPDVSIYLYKPSAANKPSPSDSMASGSYAQTKGQTPLALWALCLVGLGLALLVEFSGSLVGRPRFRWIWEKLKVPSLVLSSVVIAVSGYHVATLIGILR